MSEVIQGDTVEREYEVESGIVILNIIVGEGQVGTSVVWLDNQVIAKGDLGPVTLGPGAILTGRVLGIRTLALDINPMTNRTAVTYILTGGATELDVTLTQDAQQADSAMVYAARFSLVAKGENA
jgi:hypothetical protein